MSNPAPDATNDLPLPIEHFPENGAATLGHLLPADDCANLRAVIDQHRPMEKEIFYQSRDEFEKLGRWERYAPGRADHNFLLTDHCDTRFIEEHPAFIDAMRALAGDGYSILKKSIIRSAPHFALPEWVLTYVRDVGRPNLNPFVRDEFQDVQYFFYTDFHHDKTRPTSNFVTVYIYLDTVEADYSSLRILLGSHELGMTRYPHILRRAFYDRSLWYYNNENGDHMKSQEFIVTGTAGDESCFHDLTLHGTVRNNSKNPRISLRYLVTPEDDRVDCLQNRANARIRGPLYVDRARLDVNPDGSFKEMGASIFIQE